VLIIMQNIKFASGIYLFRNVVRLLFFIINSSKILPLKKGSSVKKAIS